MKYDVIIYDIDGTLLDTIAMNMYPLMRIIEEETGEKKSFDQVKHCFSMTGKQTLEYWGIDYERVYPRWVQYVNEYEEKAAAFEGIDKMLSQIQKMGIRQAVCSAKTHAQYAIDMQDSQLLPYIDLAVLFEDTAKHKPDPEPLLLCANKMQASLDRVLYVGDALADGLAAQAAQIDFAWAKWAGIEVAGMPTPQYLLLKPEDLIEVLNNE